PEEYSRESLAVGACERARDLGVDVHPGEDVGFVVVSESAPRYSGRVRLSFEDVESYDLGFYRRRLVEAAESLVSPFGWRRRDVVDHLEGVEDSSLSAFG
ncbi:MAG: DNA polymerase I, partial [Halobacteriota archaeon]